ncbi:hypothetical protein [Shimia ponticola]|uniref:hypothetical protein n=1 Tax=Shimia ponticola TaxID=2582893 RepID=UPI0011BE33DA|nr:hypothetical protein [Shimia ponticola]
MKSLFRSIVAILAVAPISVAAQPYGNCTFTQECFEGEACADTDFGFELRIAGTATDQGEPLSIITDAETISVFRPITFEDGHVMAGQSRGQAVFLSVAPDGAARYSAHFNSDGFSITYTGTCEVP